jgi:large subunit ribosomal protein L23
MKSVREVIVRPLITERGTALKGKGKYLFEVSLSATKQEIREAVEKVFKKDKVKVTKVNTTTVPGKVRRFGRNLSKDFRWKKAVVTLKPGQKIEVFEGA